MNIIYARPICGAAAELNDQDRRIIFCNQNPHDKSLSHSYIRTSYDDPQGEHYMWSSP